MRPLIPLALASLLASDALAYAPQRPNDYKPGFELTGRIPATTGRASLAPGSHVAATADGALAIDSDSGQLVLADATGRRVAALEVGAGAALLVFDPAARRAYVTDRRRDRVLVVEVRAKSLAVASQIATPVEPYGLALAPDARTLLVTSIADRVVVAYDAATGEELWRTAVALEPRGIAIAPDGKHALVTHTATDAIEMIDLASHKAKPRALRHDIATTCTTNRDEKSGTQCADPDATSYARGAFAAMFLGNELAAVAYQRETSVPRPRFAAAGSYGGSAVPITRHVAFVGVAGAQAIAQVATAEPRALAYDADRDLLFVAGMGNDLLVTIEHASTAKAAWGDTVTLAAEQAPACGVDGLAIAGDGDVLAWCAFTRSLVRVHIAEAPPKSLPRYDVTFTRGPELVPTAMTAGQHDGFVRFHHESPDIAHLDRAACATCHLDGRSDGLSWAIEDHALRTPVLAGRLVGTAPYKWFGRDADLGASVMSTIKRLGGSAAFLAADHPELGPDSLVAYLESLPAPRAPKRAADQVARGKALFESAELGCAGCHQGAAFTDHQAHAFAGFPLELDTPSLRGLAATPRYLHDGSAATLDDVLAERGSVRGMIARRLDASERADLIAFLEAQ